MKADTATPKVYISLEDLKNDMEMHKGHDIEVIEYNRQSKKTLNTFFGKIFEVHTNLFIMTIPHKNYVEKKSFSYSGFQSGLLRYTLDIKIEIV